MGTYSSMEDAMITINNTNKLQQPLQHQYKHHI